RLGIVPQVVRNCHAQADVSLPTERSDHLERVYLRAAHYRSQTPPVDADSEARERTFRRADGAREGACNPIPELPNPLLVIRITNRDHPLVLRFDRVRTGLARGYWTLAQHKAVVGSHMHQTVKNAALGEVHLLAITRTKGHVERADKI